MAADPIARAEFIATIQRLDSADLTTRLLLDNHIAEYRREAAEMKMNVNGIEGKLDLVLQNQSRIRGRDGAILVLIMAFVTICTGVITASIVGVIR